MDPAKTVAGGGFSIAAPLLYDANPESSRRRVWSEGCLGMCPAYSEDTFPSGSGLEFLPPVAGDSVFSLDDFQRRFLFPAVIDRIRAAGLELAAGRRIRL